MADPFRERVAVITGGGSGIGAGLARAFAARGARLVLADIDEEALAETSRALGEAGAEVVAVPTDVRDRAAVRALADRAFAAYGAVHLLCNNAGVATFGPIARATDADWDFTLGVNLLGVVHGVQAFVPRMIEQGEGGHVVNTASMAGLVGMAMLGIYCTSKFGVVGLSEALHVELRPHGIGVSVLCPGLVATRIGENTRRLHPELRGAEPDASGAPDIRPTAVLTPDEVASRVVAAIDRGWLYVITHPEQWDMLRRRAARIERACREQLGEGGAPETPAPF